MTPTIWLLKQSQPAPAIWEYPGSGRQFAEWPRPGFFRFRATRKGPWLPAVIYRPCPFVQPDPRYDEGSAHPADWCRPTERPRPLCALLNGNEFREAWEYGERISGVDKIWRWGHLVTADEYEEALRNAPTDETRGLDEIPSLF